MKSLSFDEISIGDGAEFSRQITWQDVRDFARLSGDKNPLHVDSKYACSTQFKKCVVHGMLVASLFSQFVGVHLPGKYCLYLSQGIIFRHPVFAGETIKVRGKVVQKSEGTRIIELALEATVNGIVVADGTARVKVLQ